MSGRQCVRSLMGNIYRGTQTQYVYHPFSLHSFSAYTQAISLYLSASLLLCFCEFFLDPKTMEILLLKDNHHQHQQPPGAGTATGANYNGNNAGPTTIHIPLSGSKPVSGNGAGMNIPQEAVNRTTVWQQINKDGNGISEQLIIPVTVKVRQINGNQTQNLIRRSNCGVDILHQQKHPFESMI
ncbi:Hypothetical predicted protein [Drosophila guanche]|uniref:Uncharacterized protein n=1 Tax=Drosophila guanche TaxID=7266 RepID=A0A3B0JNV1_DROGU|nr:Hypothetical predicted protein [Drosophila guanche]